MPPKISVLDGSANYNLRLPLEPSLDFYDLNEEAPWLPGEYAWADEEVPDEIGYIERSRSDRTYLSRSFDHHGEPARFVSMVSDRGQPPDVEYDGRQWLLRTSEGGRSQVKMLVQGRDGNVARLWFVRVERTKGGVTTKRCICLEGPDAARVIELIRNLEYIPVFGCENSVRVDDTLVRDLWANPNAMTELYRKNPDQFRRLITDDSSARDVVAVAYRREQVERFRRLLEDDAYFDGQVLLTARRRPEDVWQEFFEANPWILGVSLTGQLLTSWNDEKLERVVAGASIAGPGKRIDALMRTAGTISALVFAEFKTHRTRLLDPGKPYRAGCFAPSAELTAGIAQVQGTVDFAIEEIGQRLQAISSDGSEVPGDCSYIIHPRSFLIIGSLTELIGERGGVHDDRLRSFERYRRNIVKPEIITYDELLARAEWHVTSATTQAA